jgi:hypothetical protein
VRYEVTFFGRELLCVRIIAGQVGRGTVHALLLRATGGKVEEVGAEVLFVKGSPWRERLLRIAEQRVSEDPTGTLRETYLPPRFETIAVADRCSVLAYLIPAIPQPAPNETAIAIPCSEIADILAPPLSEIAKPAKAK